MTLTRPAMPHLFAQSELASPAPAPRDDVASAPLTPGERINAAIKLARLRLPAPLCGVRVPAELAERFAPWAARQGWTVEEHSGGGVMFRAPERADEMQVRTTVEGVGMLITLPVLAGELGEALRDYGYSQQLTWGTGVNAAERAMLLRLGLVEVPAGWVHHATIEFAPEIKARGEARMKDVLGALVQPGGDVITARDYQRDARVAVEGDWRRGVTRSLVVQPTGTGKTTVIGDLALREPGTVLALAHTSFLIRQIAARLIEMGARAEDIGLCYDGMVPAAGLRYYVSTFHSAPKLPLEHVDLLVIDEAHRSLGASYLRQVARFERARLVGFTATPARSDGRGLGDLYSTLHRPITAAQALERQLLVPTRYFVADELALDELRVAKGDYDQDDAGKKLNTPVMVGNAVAEYDRHGQGEPWVMFCCTVSHAYAVRDALRAAGYSAETIVAETKDAERARLFEQHRSGEISVLTGVDVFTEGYDNPELRGASILRPTKSKARWIQMEGRIKRPCDGKAGAVLIDHTGCYHVHGAMEDADTEWTLDGKKGANATTSRTRKIKAAVEKRVREWVCEHCSVTYTGTARCNACGGIQRVERAPADIRTVEGELIEAERHAAAKAAGTQALGRRVRDWTPAEKRDVYGMLLWLAQQRADPRKPGDLFKKRAAARYRYQELLGVLPAWSADDVEPVRPSAELLSWEHSRRIAWAAANRKKAQAAKQAADPFADDALRAELAQAAD